MIVQEALEGWFDRQKTVLEGRPRDIVGTVREAELVSMYSRLKLGTAATLSDIDPNNIAIVAAACLLENEQRGATIKVPEGFRPTLADAAQRISREDIYITTGVENLSPPYAFTFQAIQRFAESGLMNWSQTNPMT